MAGGVPFDEAFRSDIAAEHGGWRDVLSSVRRKVSALTTGHDRMWIGIASNEVDGLRARWNAKYRDLGMRSIAAVYITGSDAFRKNLEADLVDFYEAELDNEVGGGGGPVGAPPYTVYVAWK
eukprot:a367441_4.p3 GENE.a367441_4~~a367441_4.p3  ORF type:complete len:136 (-),score=21.49 a367441_4:13-378(-)